jgi:putative phage-type endonuclease
MMHGDAEQWMQYSDDGDPVAPPPVSTTTPRTLPVLGHEVPLYCTANMSRDEWLARRTALKSIGASSVASVLGWSPWESPLECWEYLTGRREKRTSDPMKLGTELEPMVRQHFARETGMPVAPWPFQIRHPRVERLTCNLDGVVQHQARAVVELKYSSWRYARYWDEWESHGDASLLRGTSLWGYYLQVQAQLEVTGLETGYIGALVGEEAALALVLNAYAGLGLDVPRGSFKIFLVRRDAELGAWLADQVDRFGYWHIERDEMPPVTRPVDLAAVRRHLVPEEVEQTRDELAELHAEVLDLKAKRKDAKALFDALEGDYDTARGKLAQQLGRFGRFAIAGREVIHKRDKAGRARFTGA